MVPVPAGKQTVFVALLAVEFTEGDPEDYLLPLAFASAEESDQLVKTSPQLLIARLRVQASGTEGVLYDASANKDFSRALGEAMPRRRCFTDSGAKLRAFASNSLRTAEAERGLANLEPSPSKNPHSNATTAIGEKYFLKLFRRVEQGINPELEMGRFLNERDFASVPRVAGWLDFERSTGERVTAAVLTEMLPSVKSGWEFTLDAPSRYFQRLGLGPDYLTAASHPQNLAAGRGVPPARLAKK